MKLSVIIVSYNVKHYLKQCLHSTIQSAKNLVFEIICIDNNSIDGSAEMITHDFPEINLIKNDTNAGFAKACNQGLRKARGEYVLILNPDTVLEPDSLTKPLAFMDEHLEAGSLGVKMLDGNGKFLPESKRGLPTPLAAFYKMSGLSKLFYPSRIFGKYYLDNLNPDKIHSVHVLTGAYMLIRKSVLEITGLFDEDFFMYGEDIDLSHRIIKAGFKNYYFPESRIIHYKGESTQKGSINYVYNFYKAMLVFSKKHFSKKNNRALSLLIKTAILFRASISVIKRLLNPYILPLTDITLFILGLMGITRVWETLVIYPNGGAYPLIFHQLFIPAYAAAWAIAIFLSGGYKKPGTYQKLITGIIGGTVSILLIYSLLGESLRFSRSIILLGSLWGIIALPGFRWMLNRAGIIRFGQQKAKRLLIVAKPDEAERIINILADNNLLPEFYGFIPPDGNPTDHNKHIGSLDNIADVIRIFNINELIFCARDISYEHIINKLAELHSMPVTCKIAPENGFSIIGSKSISGTEDLYLHELSVINSKSNVNAKRAFDLGISLFFFATLPLGIFIIPNFTAFLKNICLVFSNQKSWVGYHPVQDQDFKLPVIKKGVLYVTDGLKMIGNNPRTIRAINLGYAQKYHFKKDLNILFTGYKKLGRQEL